MLLFIQPYIRGFMSVAHRLPPLLCVFFFLGIVWLDFGAGLNIPALVWHDNSMLQATAGFSITALFAYVWLVTYILDARFHPEVIKQAVDRSRKSLAFKMISWAIPPTDENSPIDIREGGDGLRWYLGATFVPCVLPLILPAFFAIDGTSPFVHVIDPDSGPPTHAYILDRWPFAIGVALALVAMRLVAWLAAVVGRRTLTSDRRKDLAHRHWLQSVAAVLLVILAILYAGLCVLVHRDAWQPPPVTATCMLFGLLAGVSGAVWFHARYFAVPILIGLIAWVSYCNRPDYKLHFPHLEAEYAAVLDLEDHEEPPVSLAEVVAPDGNRTKAERDEAERVAKLVATIQSQRDKKLYTDQIYQDFASKGLTEPKNYEQLYRRYRTTLDLLKRDEEQALIRWKNQFKGRATNDRPKLVILTATGGANRSGLWTAKVLNELHNDPTLKEFPKHLRIITGASGGMVGASYYVGSVQANGSLQEGFDPLDIAQDFLTPIINSLVFREIPLLTLPNEWYDRDRGEMLDRAMEGDVPSIDPAIRQRLNNVFARNFEGLAEGEDKGWRPSLIFSPMIVEDGRRLMISNRHVPFLTVYRGEFLLPNSENFGTTPTPSSDGGSRKLKQAQSQTATRKGRSGNPLEEVYSRPAVEFFRLFPDARDRFHLSTAARMNATFPFLSPAVSLPTKGPRRVVDAGYYDNTGVSVAAAWLFEYRQWIADNCSGVVIVQVRDFASHRENRHVSLPAAEGGSFLPGLTGVLSAVDHARSASASYRNDDDLRRLGLFFREYFKANANKAPPSAQDFFTTVVFERYSDVGMSWYLSAADKKDILDSWKEGTGNMNPASLAKLREWWGRH